LNLFYRNIPIRKIALSFIIMLALSMPTYASTPQKNTNAKTDTAQKTEKKFNPDPYEKFNRVMFAINEKLDKYLLKPAATLYNKIVPLPINNGVDHFYNNILNVPTILNDLLQFNFYQATADSWRLVINTTVGIVGFFDVATPMGLPYSYEGFGLTMAKWGWENSSYLYIPVFGPETIRDTLALPVDYFSTPLPYMTSVKARNYLFLMFLVDKRAQLLHFQKVYEEAALDPYIFQRNIYLQRQAYLIKRNKELDDPYKTAENVSIEQSEATATQTTNKSKKAREEEEIYYLDE